MHGIQAVFHMNSAVCIFAGSGIMGHHNNGQAPFPVQLRVKSTDRNKFTVVDVEIHPLDGGTTPQTSC